jgi:hypothetical protein
MGMTATGTRTLDDNVLAIAHENGTIIYYDVEAAAQVGGVSYIGSNQGAWYSPKHDVFIARTTASELKVYASAVRPSSLSNPVAVSAIAQGRVSQVRVRLLGANSDACEGELVAWSLTAGSVALPVAQRTTDADGYGYNNYLAPVTGRRRQPVRQRDDPGAGALLMFEQIFESESPTYELAPAAPGPYSAYLLVPPRIYGESITGCEAFFTVKENTADSLFTINAYCVTDITTFPGYDFARFRFDGYTGAYLDRTNVAVGSAFDHKIYQSRDGSLWREDITGPVFEVDTLTFERPAHAPGPGQYGTTILLADGDCALDLIVMHSGNEDSNQIGGLTYQRRAGAPDYASASFVEIMPEDARRCHVRRTNNMLNLVDGTGTLLPARSAPAVEAGAVDVRYAGDRLLRRLLMFTQRADATDGACLSTATGFYPVPLGVGLTPPIPLRAPRAGRSTPFLCKVYGDAGEPIPGVKITATAGSADIVGAPPFTDGDGEALVNLIPDAAGTDTLAVSVDV